MGIVWKLAEAAGEREDVYRFRYEQYFAGMGDLPGTDHGARRVWLPHDDCSWHFAARSSHEKIIAVGTATPAAEPSLYQEWREMFELSRLGKLVPQLILISRVVVAKEARNSALFGSLCLYLARTFMAKGYHYAAHYCAPGMVPMYERLGYRLYGRGKALHGGEYRLPMLYLADDRPYLCRVRSPFRSLAEEKEGAFWCAKAMQVCPELSNSPLCAMPREAREQCLTSLYPPLSAQPELLRRLARGSILALKAGDVLAPEGKAEGAFYVLSGILECGGRIFPGTIMQTGRERAAALENTLVITGSFDKE